MPVSPPPPAPGRAGPGHALQIQLFGGVDLSRGDRPLPPFATQKAKALFAFLVLHRGRAHTRDALVGVFWGDRPEAVARKCLRTDIWRVRRVLNAADAEAGTLLTVEDHKVGFNPATPHWLDVAEFERLLRGAGTPQAEAMPADEAEALEGAVRLYRGDLLEGIYDDWCLYERERMRLMFLSALERLMRYRQAREEWGAAAELGQRLLAADPLREHVHRELIRCFYLQGNRPAALRQYSDCERILRAELDIEPMVETRLLSEEIRAEVPLAVPARRAPGDVPALRAEVDAALSTLEAATRQLERVRLLLHGPGEAEPRGM